MLKSLSSACTVTQEDDTGEAGVGWQALRELADNVSRAAIGVPRLCPTAGVIPLCSPRGFHRSDTSVSAWSQTASFLPISASSSSVPAYAIFLHRATCGSVNNARPC